MPRQQWYWIGLGTLLLGLMITTVLLLTLDPNQRGAGTRVAFGGLIGLTSLWPFWIASRERDVGPDQLQREQREFETACKQAEKELRRQSEILEKRERKLADMFLLYESWMEYPLDGMDAIETKANESAKHQAEPQASSASKQEPPVANESATPPHEDASPYDEQDRRVARLLEEKSELLFEKIKANEYAKDGPFEIDLLRDDLIAIVIEVARVYTPDSKNPLLETSVEQLLRAGSRTCLHLLVLMERLPVNIAAYNLQSLHGYLRQALKAYKVYQAVQPYMPYFQYATYAGRMVMGTNPVSLGAQWALWKLGSKGASAATKRLVNRQALGFVHDSINVIGYEVAGIYGGDFRHRDRQWIYAAELSELVSRFPLSREVLIASFAEVGSLSLRSEYDRVFLYRCFAAHRSAKPSRFEPAETLSVSDRKWVVMKLETFIHRFFSDHRESKMQKWLDDVEPRLGMLPNIERGKSSQSNADLARSVARSLALMLTTERQIETDRLPRLLRRSVAGSRLAESDIAAIVTDLTENHPGSFEIPDVDADSDWVDVLFTDLVTMTACTLSSVPYSTAALEWCAEYYRFDERRLKKLTDAAIGDYYEQRLSGRAPATKMSTESMICALQLVPDDVSIEFAYPKATIVSLVSGFKDRDEEGRLVLIAFGSQLLLVDYFSPETPLWQSNSTVQMTLEKRLLQFTALIEGGEWIEPAQRAQGIQIQRMAATKQDAYFEPLQRIVDSIRQNNPSES